MKYSKYNFLFKSDKHGFLIYNSLMKINKILILFILLLFYINSYTQHLVKGKVLSENDSLIEFFNVTIINPFDSTIITGGAFLDGHFELNNIIENEFILKISSVAYNPYDTLIKTSQKAILIDIGTIKLTNLLLNGVVITAKRPTFKMDNDKLSFIIENSTITDIGNALDVLNQTPMILIDGQKNIEVVGKGSPVIYIDNRKIFSSKELEILNSSDIQKIDVITNPSAKYEAEGQSVIQITTKSNKKNNGLSCSLRSELRKATKIYGNSGIVLGYKKNKLNVFINYEYNYGNKWEGEKEEREQMYNNGKIYKSKYDKNTIDYLSNHIYRMGFDYTILKKHRIGFQTNGWFAKDKIEQSYLNKYSFNNQQGSNITISEATDKSRMNVYNLNYNFAIDTSGQNLSIISDFMTYDINNFSNIKETDSLSEYYTSYNQLFYNMFSIKVDYTLPLLKLNSNIETGIKYSDVSDKSESYLQEDKNNNYQNIYLNEFAFNEKKIATYLNLTKNIKKWSFQSGLRFESVIYNAQSNGNEFIDSINTGFSPSLLLNYKQDNYSVSCSYSKKYSRPSYRKINPIIEYFDKYTYMKGNTALIPEIIDVIELTSSIKNKLILNLGYTSYKNTIGPAYTQDEINNDITIVYWKNYSSLKHYYFNLTHIYETKSGIFSTQNNSGFTKPVMQINDHGEYRQISKPMFYYSNITDIILPYEFTLSAYFQYYAMGETSMDLKEPIYKLTIGLRKKILNKKLIISLLYNDVFGTWIWKDSWSIDNMYRQHIYYPDESFIKFKITWNTGTFKPSLINRISNQDEKNRL